MSAGQCTDAGSLLDVVHETLEWIEAHDARRVADEVRQGVDVVQIQLAVAFALQILDAADVDVRGFEDSHHGVDDPFWWVGGLDLACRRDRAELELAGRLLARHLTDVGGTEVEPLAGIVENADGVQKLAIEDLDAHDAAISWRMVLLDDGGAIDFEKCFQWRLF